MNASLRIVLSFAAVCLCAPLSGAQTVVKTWWPDPSTNLMWTGDTVGAGGNVVFPGSGARSTALQDHAHAVSLCTALRLNDDTDWRLPTYAELQTVIKPRLLYEENYPDRPYSPNYNAPYMYDDVEFNHIGHIPLWSDSPDGYGGFMMWRWPASERIQVLLASVGVFCVRSMDANLLQLAKAARALSPVSGIAELQVEAALAKSQDDIDASHFAAAIDDAKAALALVPQESQAIYDMGLAYSYLGQWDDAVKTLRNKKYNSSAYVVNQDSAKKFQKQSLSDANVNKAWSLVAVADAGVRNQRYTEAAAAAAEIVQLEPKWNEGYHYLGLADGWLGKWDESVASFKRSSKILGFGYSAVESSNIAWASHGGKASRKNPLFKPTAPYAP